MTPYVFLKIRTGMGWTQTQAAAKAGVSANTWARWERGELTPNPLRERDFKRLLRLAARREAIIVPHELGTETAHGG
jgi:transcriptional regulator with XRE-family HTH domain